MSGDQGHLRRILFVADSTSGGAGIAALRLFEELQKKGADVRFLVWRDPVAPAVGWNHNTSRHSSVGLVRKFQKAHEKALDALDAFSRWRRTALRDRFFRGRPDAFEITTIFPGKVRLEEHPWFGWADIIHVHWAAGFLAPTQRWSDKRWVISLHDAYPLTAVCHFPADCTRFETGCQECPQLAGTRNPRWSGQVFEKKRLATSDGGRITLHAPSAWIAGLAARSPLTKQFPSVVLPNHFPTGIFRPLAPHSCRDLLGLPQDRPLGLFVAGHVGNVRKGFPWFLRLAERLEPEGWSFVVVGGGELPTLPSNCLVLGRLNDLRLMAAAYSAADLFVSTTLQDTVPATIVESQLCGTPVIGFDVGGQGEMMMRGETGFLAPEVSVAGLVDGVRWFQAVHPSRDSIAKLAQERWDRGRVVSDWLRFYEELA